MQPKNHRPIRRLAGVFALVVASATLLSGSRQSVDDDFFAIQKNFEIFGSMFETLVGSYVDPVDAERLMRRGISAMLQELDPYTVFIDEADYLEANVQHAQRLGTVGLDIDYRDGQLTVLSPSDGGAAFRQGVRVGDVIVDVEGRNTGELSRGDVLELLSGEPGSTVRVAIQRSGEDEFRVFSLVREVVRLDPITHSEILFEDPNRAVAYVRLANFNPGSSDRVKEELRRLNESMPLKAVILDLRDNQGGLLDAAVSISGLFLPAGSPVVSIRGRRPETYADFRTTGRPIFPDTPLVVLINRRSASSSEIVAGAIQDLDRGVIVGETSFGKGLAQNVRPLPFNTGLKITTSRFYCPSGRNVQSINYRLGAAVTPDSLRPVFATRGGRAVRGGGGIEPDLPVPRAPEGPLEAALLQSGMLFRYANEVGASLARRPDRFEMEDVDIRRFEEWLTRQDFAYDTTGDALLGELKEAFADDEVAAAATADAIATVASAIARQKQRAFQSESVAIRHALFEAIADRVVADTGEQYRTKLPFDPEVEAAVRLIDEPSSYSAILGS